MNALELADIFDKDGDGCTCFAYSASECACDAVWGEGYYKEAASELRRLHEQNRQLLEALKRLIGGKMTMQEVLEAIQQARAAIAAVEGKPNV